MDCSARSVFFILVIQPDLECAALQYNVCLQSSATASWSFGAELCAVSLLHPTKAISKFFWLNIP